MEALAYHPNGRGAELASLLAAVVGLSPAKASKVLTSYPEGRGLADATRGELQHVGLTPRQATVLAGAFALARTVAVRAADAAPQMATPGDVGRLLAELLADREQESFMAVYLDARQKVITVREVARGSLSAVDVHPREVFKPAIRLAAHCIVLAHNHPSGDTEPSTADVELTHRMQEAGRLVGVPVVDHLVCAGGEFTSFAMAGLMGAR